jgi:hypothetical protein
MAVYRRVSAYEKRLEFYVNEIPWPTCKHGVRASWHTRSKCREGGLWVCSASCSLWIAFDLDGRPHCVHGRADKIGLRWSCREKYVMASRRRNHRRIFVGGLYVGTERQFPYPRDVVENHLNAKLHDFTNHQREAAREHFTGQ